MTQGIDLDHHVETQSLLFPDRDQPIEHRLPIAIAGEVVVGDEEMADPLGEILAHDALHILGGAEPRLATLDVDDRAEGALKRTATSGVEAGHLAAGAFDAGSGEERRRDAVEPGKVGHEIVEGRQPAGIGVLQNRIEPPLGLSREERYAELLRGDDIGRHLRSMAMQPLT